MLYIRLKLIRIIGIFGDFHLMSTHKTPSTNHKSSMDPTFNTNRPPSRQPSIKESPKNGRKNQQSSSTLGINNTSMIRGGLIGVAISALVSWNTGRYSRIGSAFRRWRFTRNFILAKQKPVISLFTNYYTPKLNSVMNNFICYSGEAGIGKSYHFQNMVYQNSGIRPAIYLAFKASGKDITFEEDLAEQVDYGGDSPGILSQIIKATKKIDWINKKPHRFWTEVLLTHLAFFGVGYGLYSSFIQASYSIILFSVVGLSYLWYAHFMYPFLIQSLRRTCPLIIFDDLNKIEHLNMLTEIVRYLQLLENNMANVVLVSSDEETWAKLRRQPGVKDRLRLRQITYSHIYTAEKILEFIEDDKNYEFFMKFVGGNKLYKKNIVVSLIKELIGKRQVTLRRFTSILKLNDEQQYQKLVEVLSECENGTISTGATVQKFTDILYDSEMETMVSNLKNIKRQVKIEEQEFFKQLRILLKKGKLPSDNEIAPHLKAYNIVRDLRSEYVFNGKFMYTVFNMAIKQYEKDMKQFRDMSQKPSSVVSDAAKPPRQSQIVSDEGGK